MEYLSELLIQCLDLLGTCHSLFEVFVEVEFDIE